MERRLRCWQPRPRPLRVCGWAHPRLLLSASRAPQEGTRCDGDKGSQLGGCGDGHRGFSAGRGPGSRAAWPPHLQDSSRPLSRGGFPGQLGLSLGPLGVRAWPPLPGCHPEGWPLRSQYSAPRPALPCRCRTPDTTAQPPPTPLTPSRRHRPGDRRHRPADSGSGHGLTETTDPALVMETVQARREERG